ncbi:MAG: universal stress protein [Acidobacteriota bacterium]
MSQLNRILAATDLSAPARHAAERAAQVSKDTSAPLDLIHVANLQPLERLRQFLGATSGELERQVLDVARQSLHDLAGSLRRRFGVEAGIHVAAGTLLDELSRSSDELGVDLLVCGAKGESIVRRLFLGTTALRLLSLTTRPVLVVKLPPHESYRKILVPVDFSPSSMRAIRHARSVAPQAELVLVHAYDVPFKRQLRYASSSMQEDSLDLYQMVARQEAIKKLDALCEEAGLSSQITHRFVLHGEPTLRIIEMEQKMDCDLIVMGKHGESRLNELLLGSVTKQVLAESQGDMLISV